MKPARVLPIVLITGIVLVFPGKEADMKAQEKEAAQLTITSSAFKHNEMIPETYTCQGQDINPPLTFSNFTEGIGSLALIVDDPDAPMGTWVHWVVFNIPLKSEIMENSVPGTQGHNDFGRNEYGGPCPPHGKHRYFFKLYTLDKMLDLKEGASKSQLESAMKGHILAQAELIGLYEKKKK